MAALRPEEMVVLRPKEMVVLRPEDSLLQKSLLYCLVTYTASPQSMVDLLQQKT